MPYQNAATAAREQEFDKECEAQAETPGEINSLSIGVTTSFAEIEAQANQLLEYLNTLSSLTDRACDTAIRESESAQRSEDTRQAEVAELRSQLEDAAASIEAQRLATERLEHGYQEQISTLQNHLTEKDLLLDGKDTELRHLRVEITCLLSRLNDAEASAKRNEAGLQEKLDPLEQEIANLRSQLAQRDEAIQAKNNALRKIEMTHRGSMIELEQRLREMESQAETQAAQLRDKEAIIQATATKESEIGKLIKRLSTECHSLSVELQEKTRRLNEIEAKKTEAASEGKAWRRVIGRLQEEGI
jgi:chromosome segregation ATPase